jgi:hypothetical protein
MMIQFTFALKFTYNLLFPSKKILYILRGLPGSGKTTWIHNFMLENTRPYYICSYENFHNEYNPRDLPKSYNLCFRQFLEYLSVEKDYIFVDNPNIEKWEYMNYVVLGKLFDYDVKIIEMDCPNKNYLGVYRDRCKNYLTLKKFSSFYDRWELDKNAIIKEPYIDFPDSGDSLPYPIKNLEELDKELEELLLFRKKKLAKL